MLPSPKSIWQVTYKFYFTINAPLRDFIYSGLYNFKFVSLYSFTLNLRTEATIKSQTSSNIFAL